MVEGIVARLLLNHNQDQNLDDLHQFASLSKGKPIHLVCLHLSAVFDTIDHPTLLYYLKIWFGFAGFKYRMYKSAPLYLLSGDIPCTK